MLTTYGILFSTSYLIFDDFWVILPSHGKSLYFGSSPPIILLVVNLWILGTLIIWWSQHFLLILPTTKLLPTSINSYQLLVNIIPTQHPLNVLPTTKMLWATTYQINIFFTLFPLNILSMFYPQPRCCEQRHIKSTYSQQCPHSTFYPLFVNILPTLCWLKICFHVKNLKLGAIITIPRLYQHLSQILSTLI